MNVFAMCSYLVARGLVDKVRLSFLMVGHTHEDIDQLFSNISKSLKTHEARTMDELVSVVNETFKTNSIISEVEYVDDFATMLKDHIYAPSNHSKPHAFKFEKNAAGKVIMEYKEWSASGKWINVGEILDTDSVRNEVMLKAPTFAKKDLQECRSLIFNKHSKKHLSPEELDHWDTFLEGLETKEDLWKGSDCTLTKGKPSILKLGKQTAKRKRDNDVREEYDDIVREQNQPMKKVTRQKKTTTQKPPKTQKKKAKQTKK